MIKSLLWIGLCGVLLASCGRSSHLCVADEGILGRIYPRCVIVTADRANSLVSDAEDAGAVVRRPSNSDLFYNVDGIPLVVVPGTLFLSRYSSKATVGYLYDAFSVDHAKELLALVSDEQPKGRGDSLCVEVGDVLHVANVSKYRFRSSTRPHIIYGYMTVCPIDGFPMAPMAADLSITE
mgnify:CR=1 FL=1